MNGENETHPALICPECGCSMEVPIERHPNAVRLGLARKATYPNSRLYGVQTFITARCDLHGSQEGGK